jgi:hypothetical protein
MEGKTSRGLCAVQCALLLAHSLFCMFGLWCLLFPMYTLVCLVFHQHAICMCAVVFQTVSNKHRTTAAWAYKQLGQLMVSDACSCVILQPKWSVVPITLELCDHLKFAFFFLIYMTYPNGVRGQASGIELTQNWRVCCVLGGLVWVRECFLHHEHTLVVYNTLEKETQAKANIPKISSSR